MTHSLAALQDHLRVVQALEPLLPAIDAVADRMAESLSRGGKVVWMGNGGSAADAQHMAAELMGRFERERAPLASVALTTDTSLLTAVANDYGYAQVFARQVRALCGPADVVVALSTSGASENVLEGVRAARDVGSYCVGLVGGDGGALAARVDRALSVPSDHTARIQEGHGLIGHLLCARVERLAVAAAGGGTRA